MAAWKAKCSQYFYIIEEPKVFLVNVRYQRGSRSLADNLQLSKEAVAQRMAMSNAGVVAGSADNDDDEEYDIPDEIEDVIGKTTHWSVRRPFNLFMFMVCKY